MVFFSCEGCNETLKKNQVENHLRRASCGHYPVSCVDCSQVFHGVSYQAHTSCISEAEKYEKTLYKGPKAGGGGGKGKKRNPQEEWMDMICAAAAEGGSVVGLSPSLRGQLLRMAELGNVPRNEKKFKNFLSNSLRINRPDEQEELWKFLKGKVDAAKAVINEAEEKKKEQKEEKKEETEDATGLTTTAREGLEKEEEEETTTTPAEAQEGSKKSKKGKKKRKDAGEEEGEAAVEEEPATPRQSKKKQKKEAAVEEEKEDEPSAEAVGEAEASFPWAKTIKKLVKKAEGKKMDRQTLQKEVLALASETSTQEKKALKKKLKEVLGGGVAGVQVDGDMVMYIK